MHLNSRVHRGKQIQCPLCKGCFATATGLTHHVETGSCPNAVGLGRDTQFKFVRNKDPGGIITKNMIGWYGSAQYEATSNSYNSYHQGWSAISVIAFSERCLA
ncbi:hypothetical protein SAPIO_CDS1221 [Scedosporium apiospermum]|uniref:C2H2-type domain-containing protein n=1 Tax=Pseudallescheria apiosperma TaxID=563466 RepID=A0A084GEU7_PSEDA|nr:uncharacterized protein SAPIO_CDS1221 [Scedosporium apiospermum]KEZ45859.1 hypothetical protein SAPIO_CDS1221 [Scedosporium apiospermum]